MEIQFKKIRFKILNFLQLFIFGIFFFWCCGIRLILRSKKTDSITSFWINYTNETTTSKVCYPQSSKFHDSFFFFFDFVEIFLLNCDLRFEIFFSTCLRFFFLLFLVPIFPITVLCFGFLYIKVIAVLYMKVQAFLYIEVIPCLYINGICFLFTDITNC